MGFELGRRACGVFGSAFKQPLSRGRIRKLTTGAMRLNAASALQMSAKPLAGKIVLGF